MTHTNPDLFEIAGRLLRRFTDTWCDCPDHLPDLGPALTHNQQAQYEEQIEQFLDAALAEMDCMPAGGPERDARRDQLLRRAASFAGPVLGVDGALIDWVRSSGLLEAATSFARMARSFDASISDEAIFQACRNLWTMAILQILLGHPVEVTPAIFAYSMLYPYTDNYLDDPCVTEDQKIEFVRRFGQRLAGESITPRGIEEQRICSLVQMIEDQLPRWQNPLVYQSLLLIHAAQADSIQLLRQDEIPGENDVQQICFMKGGASVLADGYLVSSELSEAQQEACFGYGVFTQLLDDIEDVQQDIQNGLMTVYSHAASRRPLDGISARTFHFGAQAMQGLDSFNGTGSEPLKQLVTKAVIPVLIGAAGQAAPYYSSSFLQEIEKHSSLRFTFQRGLRQKMAGQKVSVMKLI